MMHNSAVGRASHISGWAAHFMPVHEFEEFYVDTMFLNIGSSTEAMMHAWRAVAHFRDFPRLVAYQTRCLSEHHLGGPEDPETRETALAQTREIIIARVENDLQKGKAASAAFKAGDAGEHADMEHRFFFEFVESETRKAGSEFPSAALHDQYLAQVRIHGWSTHFLRDGQGLSWRDYKAFHARTIIANRRPEVLAARRALQSASRLPGFPPLAGQFDVCSMLRSL